MVKFVSAYFIQEDLLKINKNMLKLIQLFTSAWRNKTQIEKEKKKNTSSCSLHNIHQTKNKTKKNNKKTHTQIYTK